MSQIEYECKEMESVKPCPLCNRPVLVEICNCDQCSGKPPLFMCICGLKWQSTTALTLDQAIDQFNRRPAKPVVNRIQPSRN